MIIIHFGSNQDFPINRGWSFFTKFIWVADWQFCCDLQVHASVACTLLSSNTGMCTLLSTNASMCTPLSTSVSMCTLLAARRCTFQLCTSNVSVFLLLFIAQERIECTDHRSKSAQLVLIGSIVSNKSLVELSTGFWASNLVLLII